MPTPPLNTPLPRLLVLLVVVTLGALLLGLLLPYLARTHPALPLHLILAVGFMPLILGATAYFTPVLTRSGAPPRYVLFYPLLALAAGLLLIGAFAMRIELFPWAALLGIPSAAGLGAWIQQRRSAALGRPHPGLLWYQLALAALALALLAIVAGYLLPEQWPALKRLHLHLNLLGFVSLTALGTLRVLLPTAAGYPDPEAGHWLQRFAGWFAIGTLLIALGSGWYPLLILPGLALWCYPLALFVWGLVTTHRQKTLAWHGPGVALTAASGGLLLLVILGGAHGLGMLAARPSIWAFVLMFLLPLISGAANHLLPLWALQQAPEKQAPARARLGRWSGLRTVLFVLAGLLALLDVPWATLPALVALLHFFQAALRVVVFGR